MACSFFFYDLETSGIDSREARIMQFAGQRTDMELNPIGDPINVLIKLTPDVVPDPDAIMLTGVTPQQTLQEGITESEFLQMFHRDIVQPETVFLGYNSVRFDDEFMRNLHYRNFYDAYEWQWCNNCSRWDMLDVVRMTRALKPEGIEWPFTEEGKPTNRLELLTKANGISHEHAHDAMNDVEASIAVARMIREKQPSLYSYLFDCRSKQKVKGIVEGGEAFVYTSGRYPSDTLHTTMALWLAEGPYDGAYVYDLRHDPTPFLEMSVEELTESFRRKRDGPGLRLPVKTIKYKRCPAVATAGAVRDTAVQKRLQLDLDKVARHRKLLRQHPEFTERVVQACGFIDTERKVLTGEGQKTGELDNVDGQLYDGLIPSADKASMRQVREAGAEDCAQLNVSFQDRRLQAMFPIYKARNHPQCLSDDDRKAWDDFCRKRLLGGGNPRSSRLAKYFERLQQLAAKPELSETQRYILEELQLYGESIMPVVDESE